MLTLSPTLVGILGSLCTLAALGWLVLAFRTRFVVRTWPVVSAGRDVEPPWADDACPRVSVIVPAHNEERIIDSCCERLRGQDWPDLEIILVLDRCTDGTLAIAQRHAAADPRIRIIENEDCPADWAGKCNAARRGAAAATGSWLLFTDADTGFAPDLIRSSVALAHDRELDLLSILSTLTHDAWHERIAQPIASIMLIRLYPVDRVNRRERPRPFANGQFMLFTRDAYEAIGGHEAVKEALLEDIAFARAIAKADRRGGLFGADGMLRCSMYSSMAAFRNGWKRIFIEACNRKPARLRKNAVMTFALGIGTPLLFAGTALAGLLGMPAAEGWALVGAGSAGLILQFGTLATLYRLSGAPAWAALFAPAGCFILGRVMLAGARDLLRRVPIRWAGKSYVLEPR